MANTDKKHNTKKSEVGRPTKFQKVYCEQALKLCLLGATDEEMADFFGVSESTLNLWKKKHPEFSESIKKGKIEADANVVVSLYKRAIGYTHDDEKIFLHEGKIIRAKTKKHYPPDGTAICFWLKNRQPKQWRDSKVLQGDDEKPIVLSTIEDRERRLEELAAKAANLLKNKKKE